MNSTIHTNSDKVFCLNSSLILEMSLIFASQICHGNINKPLDGAYLADFGIDINPMFREDGVIKARFDRFMRLRHSVLPCSALKIREDNED